MKEHIAGHDAVLSCLGPDTGGWLAESTFYNESIRPIVAAMKAVNVERLLCITTWCTNGKLMHRTTARSLTLLKTACGGLGYNNTAIRLVC